MVAHRAGRRWVRRIRSVAVEAPETARCPLQPRGTYLITGGTGGIGLTVARYLVTTVQARLVLTARTALPERSSWDELLAHADVVPALKERLRHILELRGTGRRSDDCCRRRRR